MRRGWILWILVVALLAAATWAVVHHRQTVPLDQCSSVYRKFADYRDIEASFIKDFRINDSLVIDATVLRTADSCRWQWLLDDLGCEVDVSAQPGNRLMTIKTSPLHADGNRSEGCDLIIADPQRLEVVVCHYPAGRTKEIVSYYFNKILEE